MYRIDSRTDISRISAILEPYGIYIEHDLFGNIYLMVDLRTLVSHEPAKPSIKHRS